MTKKLDAIAPKIVPLIRLLGSPVEHEAPAAVRALQRVLAGDGLDIHALADRIEHGDSEPLSAAEMQRIYDAAYEKGYGDGSEQGRRSAVLAGAQPWHRGGPACVSDSGVNGYSWQQIAQHCLVHKHLFRDRDLEFIESIAEQLAYRDPSQAQAKWLRDLFTRKLGGRIE
jgi:hypothetical protein